MGTDLSDINNDGYPDLYTTDMLPEDDQRLKTLGAFDNIDLYRVKEKTGFYHQFMKNCLFVNNQHGQFVETANYSGVSATDWSWGAIFFDADNDGLNDLYVCNGVNKDVTNLDFMEFFANTVIQKMVISGQKENVDSVLKHIPVYPVPNKFYLNKGNLSFTDAGAGAGFTQPSFSNGAAYGDLDNDGDLDMIVNNENQPVFVYRNNAREQNKNNYVGVILKGRGKNTFAIGSKIRVYSNGSVHYREIVPARGFQSSVDYKQVIGLGTSSTIDSMIIEWPDGNTSRLNPKINKVFTADQPAYKKMDAVVVAKQNQPYLQQVAAPFIKHNEDDYTDFYYERNLPEMLSREGPKIGVADVNGDGTEDVYIGGAKGQAGQLYLQKGDAFVQKSQLVFQEFQQFEDVAVCFFDSDHDGDQDLFVGSGGNNVQPNSRELQHRLYKNDGKGNFTIDTRAFPANDMNISVAVANDFDADGDVDLFVGSRSIPYSYGVTPASYLYRNDGTGRFTDVAKTIAPGLEKVGMVTGAVWTDIDGDKRSELVVTGEWMPTKVFRYQANAFSEVETSLNDKFGWWQTITAADVNGDGFNDLIIGNIGENFYLRPDAEHPVKMWLNDFDQSGTTDQFLTRTVNATDKPVFLKREITEQFPGLKKQNLRHEMYASKTVQQLFSKELLDKSEVKLFNYCSSVIALNNGKGGFSIQRLPLMVQLSNVQAVRFTDVNRDGRADLLLGGNNFNFPPQFDRLDASFGHVLINKGHGAFEWINNAYSGVNLRGEVKDIAVIKGKASNWILMVENNKVPSLFRVK